MKERFDEMAEETLYEQWLRDDERNLILTKNGSPQLNRTGTREIDGWVYHYSAVTEEDVEFLRELVSRGGHLSTGWVESLYQIFEEESTPFLIGQKELEDVVDAMERRMMLVYSEMYD